MTSRVIKIKVATKLILVVVPVISIIHMKRRCHMATAARVNPYKGPAPKVLPIRLHLTWMETMGHLLPKEILLDLPHPWGFQI